MAAGLGTCRSAGSRPVCLKGQQKTNVKSLSLSVGACVCACVRRVCVSVSLSPSETLNTNLNEEIVSDVIWSR